MPENNSITEREYIGDATEEDIVDNLMDRDEDEEDVK
jgi:hypothetical protein